MDSDLLLKRAEAAVVSRDFDYASRLYSSLLKDSPNNTEILLRLGNLYVKSGDDKKALEYFKKINELSPNNIQVLLSMGGVYRRLKQYDESIKVLTKAKELGADKLQVYYNLGFTYKVMGRNDDAVDCFETVVTLNPSDVLAYNHLGTIYAAQEKHLDAIQAYQMGLKVDANHPILHLNLAKSFEASGNIKNAEHEYEAALRYKPGWSEAISDYTKFLVSINKTKEASEIARSAVQLNPQDPNMHTDLGDILMVQSDYETAEEEYEAALAIDPKHRKAIMGSATALDFLGKPEEAVTRIDRLAPIPATDISMLKKSAEISLSSKRFVEASQIIKQVFENDKKNPEALDLVGQYYICTNEEEKAEKCYKRLEKYSPNYKEHLSNAARRYKQTGKMQKALDYAKEYLHSKPNNVRALTNLASINEALGNVEDALANYNKALSLDENNAFAKKATTRIVKDFGLGNLSKTNQEQVEQEIPIEQDSALPPDDFILDSEDENSSEVENNVVQDTPPVQENVVEQNDVIPPEEEKEKDVPIENGNFDFDAFGDMSLEEDDDEFDLGDDDVIEENDLSEKTKEAPQRIEIDSEPQKKNKDESVEENKEDKVDIPPITSSAQDDENLETLNDENLIDEQEDDTDLTDVLPQEGSGFELEPALDEMPLPKGSYVPPEPALQNTIPNHELLSKMNKLSQSAERAMRAADEALYATRSADRNTKLLAREAARDEMEDLADEIKRQAERKAKAAAEEKMEELTETANRALKATEELSKKVEARESLVPPEPLQEEEPQEENENEFVPFTDDNAFEGDLLAPDQDEEVADETVKENEEIEEDSSPTTEDENDTDITPNENTDETTIDEEPNGDTPEARLFQKLQSLIKYLPDDKRKAFLQSKTRLQLDYVVARLTNQPGLLETAQSLRSKESNLQTESSTNGQQENQHELIKDVLEGMKSLTKDLPDKTLSEALDSYADEVEKQI